MFTEPSIAYSVSTTGFLLAICMVYLIHLLTPQSFENDEWRIAFIISGVLGIIYHLLNKRHSHPEQVQSRKNASIKIQHIIREQWLEFIGVILLVIFQGSMYFFAYSYMYTYLTETLHYSKESSYTVSIIMLCVGCVLYPVFGYLADITNKQKISIAGSIVILPFCYLLIHANSVAMVVFYGVILVACHAAICSGISSISAEVFSQKWRMTASATAYNIGTAIAGFFPMLSQQMINEYGRFSLVYLVVGVVFLGFVAHFIIRSSKGHKLITHVQPKFELKKTVSVEI